MARNNHLIFVDEVKATPPFEIYNFTGILIKQCDYAIFSQEFNKIKDNAFARIGGKNVNVHYYPLTRRARGSEFESIKYYEEQSFWVDMSKLLQISNYHIIAGVVHMDNYKSLYKHHRVNLEILAFKLFLQNCSRYLLLNNGCANLVIESSNDDLKLQEEFYKCRLTGSKYISHTGYRDAFRSIEFKKKDMLIEGLQAVDLLANPVSRKISQFNQFNIQKFGCASMDDIISPKIYDGGCSQPFEYGIRKIFC